MKIGDNWKLLSGKLEGETFQSEAMHGKYIPFEHPFDLNFSTKSVRGWPKILVEVWQIDDHGRNSIAGYGITTFPFQDGEFKLDIMCWRPAAGFFDKLIGAYPELKYRDILLSTDSRFGLRTESTGKVYLEFSVMTKDFHLHGVKL